MMAVYGINKPKSRPTECHTSSHRVQQRRHPAHLTPRPAPADRGFRGKSPRRGPDAQFGDPQGDEVPHQPAGRQREEAMSQALPVPTERFVDGGDGPEERAAQRLVSAIRGVPPQAVESVKRRVNEIMSQGAPPDDDRIRGVDLTPPEPEPAPRALDERELLNQRLNTYFEAHPTASINEALSACDAYKSTKVFASPPQPVSLPTLERQPAFDPIKRARMAAAMDTFMSKNPTATVDQALQHVENLEEEEERGHGA